MVWLAKPAAERFAAKYMPVPESGCWLWIAGVVGRGYGAFHMDKMEQAHRASWLLHVGHIPDGLCVCHKCDTPLCVNPAHLFLATVKENNADRDRKGRRAVLRGEHAPGGKLTEAEVLAIRAAPGLHREIAVRYGIARESVSDIKGRRTWRHVA